MGSVWRASAFLAKGLREFTASGYASATANFDNSVMQRELKGRYCMVTGANQGLGFETSQELAKRGATLFMVCRNEERGKEAVQKLSALSGNKDIHLKVCDISSQAAVRQLAGEYIKAGFPLHVLVNNAGILLTAPAKSADGLEMSFATNTMGAFHLTRLLEPVLKRSEDARVIFVASGGMYTELLEVDDLESKKSKFDGSQLYAKDKRRMVAYTEQFAKRWQGTGIGSFSMHPGWTATEGVKTSIPGFYNTFQSRMRNLAQGADTIVWLVLQDQKKLQPGAFYLDRRPATKHLLLAGTSYTDAQVEKLWENLSATAGLPT